MPAAFSVKYTFVSWALKCYTGSHTSSHTSPSCTVWPPGRPGQMVNVVTRTGLWIRNLISRWWQQSWLPSGLQRTSSFCSSDCDFCFPSSLEMCPVLLQCHPELRPSARGLEREVSASHRRWLLLSEASLVHGAEGFKGQKWMHVSKSDGLWSVLPEGRGWGWERSRDLFQNQSWAWEAFRRICCPKLTAHLLSLRSSVIKYFAIGFRHLSRVLRSLFSFSCSYRRRCRNVQTLGSPAGTPGETPPACSGSFADSSKPHWGSCRRQRSSHSLAFNILTQEKWPLLDFFCHCLKDEPFPLCKWVFSGVLFWPPQCGVASAAARDDASLALVPPWPLTCRLV